MITLCHETDQIGKERKSMRESKRKEEGSRGWEVSNGIKTLDVNLKEGGSGRGEGGYIGEGTQVTARLKNKDFN